MLDLTIAEEALVSFVKAMRWATEAMGAIWVTVGFVSATRKLVPAVLRGSESCTPARLTFSRYLSLALELQLASDVLSTAIAPSWSEIGKLAATAVVRTGLNFFLSREIRAFQRTDTGLLTESPAPAVRIPD